MINYSTQDFEGDPGLWLTPFFGWPLDLLDYLQIATIVVALLLCVVSRKESVNLSHAWSFVFLASWIPLAYELAWAKLRELGMGFGEWFEMRYSPSGSAEDVGEIFVVFAAVSILYLFANGRARRDLVRVTPHLLATSFLLLLWIALLQVPNPAYAEYLLSEETEAARVFPILDSLWYLLALVASCALISAIAIAVRATPRVEELP